MPPKQGTGSADQAEAAADLPQRRPARLALAGLGGCAVFGIGVAALTLRLNPHLHGSFRESAVVLAWSLAGFSAFGGCFGWLLDRLVGRVSDAGRQRRLAAALAAILCLAPILYLCLLPDAGLTDRLLTDLLSLPLPGLGAIVLAIASGLALGGIWLDRWPAARSVTAVLVSLLAVGLGASALSTHQAEAGTTDPPVEGGSSAGPSAAISEPVPRVSDPAAAPLALLMIDGADPEVIASMIEQGELPSFARLRQQGVWGSLETLVPTLSPVIWTSVATGRPPQEHGVWHFVHARLPGMRRSILHFPLHTGLNFHLLGILERLPLFPTLRFPYTSNMRRTQALWNMVGQAFPVGVYRWLATWPAEPVPGFNVAGGIAWVQFDDSVQEARQQGGAAATRHPPDLYVGIDRRPLEVTADTLSGFLREDLTAGADSSPMQRLRRSASDPTVRILPQLAEKYDIRFLASGFYEVDTFQHHFSRDLANGGKFAPAIHQRYRLTDRRLGELLAALGDGWNVIVVSDHGYDFEHHHHTWAPPGIFLAHGPNFLAGQEIRGLSIFDIAPMVLHLLSLPLPTDLPGTRTGTYRRALRPELLSTRPATFIPTYEGQGRDDQRLLESPMDSQIKDALRNLGYIH